MINPLHTEILISGNPSYNSGIMRQEETPETETIATRAQLACILSIPAMLIYIDVGMDRGQAAFTIGIMVIVIGAICSLFIMKSGEVMAALALLLGTVVTLLLAILPKLFGDSIESCIAYISACIFCLALVVADLDARPRSIILSIALALGSVFLVDWLFLEDTDAIMIVLMLLLPACIIAEDVRERHVVREMDAEPRPAHERALLLAFLVIVFLIATNMPRYR